MATKKLTDAEVRNAKAKPGQRLEMWDANTPGLCLRVSPGRRVWLVRYRAAGKQRRYSLGEYPDLDLSDARVAAAKILRDARKKGADPAGDKEREDAVALAQPIKTFSDLAEAYLAACHAGRWRPRRKVQSARTLKDARESLDRYLLPELGKLELPQVTRSIVKKFLRGMADRGIRAQTNTALSLIRRVYNWAIVEFEGELVSVNVADGQERQEETARTRTLSDPELSVFWAALKNPGDLRAHAGPEALEGESARLSRQMAILLQLAVLLLQRRGELAGMMASEVNLDLAQWLIPAPRMKARRPHLVPLAPRSVELLREALKLADMGRPPPDSEGHRPNDFPIFPSPRDPTRPIRPASVTHAMKKVTKAIAIHAVSPHDLRRTGSTALTSERIEVSRFIRSLVLAHASGSDDGGAAVSTRHYDANDYAREKRRALEEWESLALEIVGERPRSLNVRPMRAAS